MRILTALPFEYENAKLGSFPSSLSGEVLHIVTFDSLDQTVSLEKILTVKQIETEDLVLSGLENYHCGITFRADGGVRIALFFREEEPKKDIHHVHSV